MIEILVYLQNARLPKDLLARVKEAHQRQLGTVEYAGLRLRLLPSQDGSVARVYYHLTAPLNSLPKELPAAFGPGGLPVQEIWLRVLETPNPLRAVPGWYSGYYLGFSGADVNVDPSGQTTGGQPFIGGRGGDFPMLREFLLQVLDCRMAPSRKYA
jgi:hypothetical protein